MEYVRGLLEEYFSEEESDGTDVGGGDIFESYFESIYNTYLSNENVIQKSFSEIIREGGIERIFKGGEKILENAARNVFKSFNLGGAVNYGGDIYGGEETFAEEDEKSFLSKNVYGLKRDGEAYDGLMANGENYEEGIEVQGDGIDKTVFLEKKGDIFKDGLENAISGGYEFNESLRNIFNKGDIIGGGDIYKSESVNNGSFYTEGDKGYFGAGESIFGGDSLSGGKNSLRNEYHEDLGDRSESILNEYMGGSGQNTINNNISPTINLYNQGGGDIDIDEIVERITDMLAESAAGEAGGAY